MGLILVNAKDGIYESFEINKLGIVNNAYFLLYQFYKVEILFGKFVHLCVYHSSDSYFPNEAV